MFEFVKRLAIMAAVSFFVSGCALIGDELNRRGGFVAAEEDKNIFPVDSKLGRAFRDYAIQASLIRLASVSSLQASERSTIVSMHINANDRLSNVVRCAQKDRTCFEFDSLMLDYEKSLFQLARAVLLDSQNTTLAENAVALFIPGPPGGASFVTLLLRAASTAWKLGLPLGALYRDSTELQVKLLIVRDNSYSSDKPDFDTYAKNIDDVIAAYETTSDLELWRNALKAAREAGYKPVPELIHFAIVYDMIAHYCKDELGLSDTQVTQCTNPPNVFAFGNDINKSVFEYRPTDDSCVWVNSNAPHPVDAKGKSLAICQNDPPSTLQTSDKK